MDVRRVPAETLANYALAAPPESVAIAFGRIVQPWFKFMTCINRQSKTLAALRDALLPRLVSGEVRVGLDSAV